MTQAHLFISGMVQGVGFRRFVKKQAQNVDLTGWVRNLPDGRVEAILQGGKKQIEHVIAAYRKGPFLAEVEEVEVTWGDATGTYTDFIIRSMVS